MRAPEFWAPNRSASAPARALTPLAWGFDIAGQVRRALTTTRRAAVPVICVGNLVAGGAGKTPAALGLARLVLEAGKTPHFLTRGYGGHARGPLRVEPERHDAATVGDEALLLAAVAPTWVARDRAAGAAAAAAAGAELVIMDDGLQNPSLAKDLALVVVDGGFGFGNGRLIPAGPLREPIARGLRRADAVVLVGADRVGVSRLLPSWSPPLLRASLVPGKEAYEVGEHPVVAFAGIARPDKFFETLAEIGCQLVGRHGLPDHHRFSADEVMAFVEEAQAKKALAVTTEKDFVRLPEAARAMVKVLTVSLEWQDPAAVSDLLRPALERAGADACHG